ncbi:MAG: GNAT family N-acetyltransferase [Lachnospiraceae bacterium]|nr:GNAT family N-acetyltransferase [Lachnospiraceae bacterium]
MSDGDSCSCSYSYFDGDEADAEQIKELWLTIDSEFDPVLDGVSIIMAKLEDELVGMLHVAIHEVSVNGSFVSGARFYGDVIKQKYDEAGVMEKLIDEASKLSLKKGAEFAFCAPANPEYFSDKGFDTLYENVELDIDISVLEDDSTVPDDLSGEEGYYLVKFRDLSDEDLDELGERINEELCKRYAVFVKRDGAYLKAVRDRHILRNGGAMAVYESGISQDEEEAERLAAVFSYDITGDTLYVERYENFDANVRYSLDTIVKLTEEVLCKRCLINMPSSELVDDVYNLLGIWTRVNDGKTVMAKALSDTFSIEQLKKASFFDEI